MKQYFEIEFDGNLTAKEIKEYLDYGFIELEGILMRSKKRNYFKVKEIKPSANVSPINVHPNIIADGQQGMRRGI